ncbi:MAG TPA: DUF1109 domain-containing protein [Parvularculaceae bacterium]|nr:DUF1109 domain-containing protein [Parvularculaceae bacterium]
METDDLINDLARNAKPVPARAADGLMLAGVAGGGVVSVIFVLTALGARPDFGAALLSFSFWMKGVYVAAIAVGAVMVCRHLACPELRPSRWYWLLLAPPAVLSVVALGELVAAPKGEVHSLIFGGSALQCPQTIFLVSLPIFAGCVLAMRRLAPTRLRAAGAAAGLAAGAIGALLYALHCTEFAAPFVLIWYSLGVIAAAALGALLGPVLLRW